MERFRLAIIGSGMITRNSHLPAALSTPQAQVVALVDTDIEGARSLAQSYGIHPRISAQLDEILPDIDGAIIATPNHTHHPLGLRCLRAGVSVLMEKPLALDVREGEELVAAAAASGAALAVGYCTRFRRNVRLLKRLLEAQHFGAVHRFYHQFGTRGGWAPVSGYNLDRKRNGGGVLITTGTHFIDRMLHFWDEPEQVELLIDVEPGGLEANAETRFHYPGLGLHGAARYSKSLALPAGMTLETDAGLVVLKDYDQSEIVLRPKHAPTLEYRIDERQPETVASVFVAQLEDFIAASRERRAPSVDGRQGLASLRLLERLYANARHDRRAYYAETVSA